MTEHSPAAIAAYPDLKGYESIIDNKRRAYDRGVADTLAVKLEADREALSKLFWDVLHAEPGEGVPTEDRLVAALFAAGIIHEASKPVVDVEALENVIDAYLETRRGDDLVNHGSTIADAILTTGILRDEREIKAEALEEAAKMVDARIGGFTGDTTRRELKWLRRLIFRRATEIRAGRA